VGGGQRSARVLGKQRDLQPTAVSQEVSAEADGDILRVREDGNAHPDDCARRYNKRNVGVAQEIVVERNCCVEREQAIGAELRAKRILIHRIVLERNSHSP
jgi:hypothetical protein